MTRTSTQDKILSSEKWQFYLTRPFTIFGASIWHHWYNSEETKKCFGTVFPDFIFIEEERDVARCYRPAKQIKELNSRAEKVLYDKKKAIQLMTEGAAMNKEAVQYLGGKKKFTSFESAVEFVTGMALRSTVLPNRLGEFLTRQKLPAPEVVKLAKKLREVSYYPRVMEEIILPMAVKELKRAGINSAAKSIGSITLSEFLKKDFRQVDKRNKNRAAGLFYFYSNQGEKQNISWIKDPISLVKKLEPDLRIDNVKGIPAYPGKVKGRVRLVNTRRVQQAKFKKGEILVSVSTSPIYLSLMKQAAAIVTDEGGLTSHASILARELKKPCITGTRFASKILKDGDMVEVDANTGTVVKI